MARDFSINANDLAGVADAIRTGGKKAQESIVKAMNVGIEKARIEQSEYIADRYELSPAYVESRLKTNPATVASPKASIVARDRRTQARRFKHSQKWTRGKTVPKKRAGIDIKFKRQGQSFLFKRAFYMDLKNGNQGIAVRTGPGKRDIQILYSTSVASAFRWARDESDLVARTNDFIKTEFFRYLGG
ncbi:MAG: hypothetical protein CMB99_16410 [Flavobacteriaceae bacterium]|nr:hypothetical protein [Flavobacteriaceae bacterium]|tara:strand:- start:29559 stop:30122 length:564 start_codon:yes stop_codon:yes gene_type:complete